MCGGGLFLSRSACQASRRAYLLPPAAVCLCPPWLPGAAPRRAGGDFKCSHPSRGTSPAHVTAAWRRPCPPHPDPAPLPEGAPWPLCPDGANTAILHLTGRPGWNLLYRRPGPGPHPTQSFSLFSSAPLDRDFPPLLSILPPIYLLPRLWAPSIIPAREWQCPPYLRDWDLLPSRPWPAGLRLLPGGTRPHHTSCTQCSCCLPPSDFRPIQTTIPCSCLSLGYCVAVAAVSPGWEARHRHLGLTGDLGQGCQPP